MPADYMQEMEIVTLFPLDGAFIRLAARMQVATAKTPKAKNSAYSIWQSRSGIGCRSWVEPLRESHKGPELILCTNLVSHCRHSTREQFAQTSYVIFEATIINTLVAYWGYEESPAILITGQFCISSTSSPHTDRRLQCH